MVVVLMVASFFLGSAVSVSRSFVDKQDDSIFQLLLSHKEQITEIQNLVENDFIGEIDQTQMYNQAIKGLVAGLGDPYTVYYTPVEAKAFWDDLNGSFEGVGLEIAYSNGQALVLSVLENSPAQSAGFAKGDVVLAVDDQDVEGMTIDEIANMIKGEAGTVVKIKVLHQDEVKEYNVERANVVAESVMTELQDDVLLIRLLRFDEDTDEELLQKIRGYNLDQIKGIIVDVRGNPGGYFDAAIKVADLFLSDGLIVSERHKDKSTEDWRAESGDVLEKYKVVVLIDGFSASASEILAGAINDNDRGLLVGEKTYGKGSVQTVESLSNGGLLKITTGEWLTPNGLNLRQEGIDPDEKVELDDVSNDLQFKKAKDIILNGVI